MKKLVIIVIVAALAGVAYYSGAFNRGAAAEAQQQAGAPGQAGQGGAQGGGQGAGGGRAGRGGRGGGTTGPLTVELGTVRRASLSQQLTVVGNLIGDATVAVVPRAAGRLQEIYVRLGDQVKRGQRVAKIEDLELQEQVKQAVAASEVSRATIRQREADLALAQTNVERSRNLFQRQLLPKQTLDDNEARYQAALAQLDLSRAQNTQSQARLDELKINLSNTNIVSPVDGFVARRAVDPGAFVGNNAPVVDVVDIRRVRLIVNVVEKDLRQTKEGDQAIVNVDAYPGETFTGRIARVAPVLDPATRTASIEIEIPNPGYRLKPGMYARVSITTDQKKDMLVVPTNALVDLGGRRGVFLAGEGNLALFRPVRTGIEEEDVTEILAGIDEGATIVTTGAGSLTDGARFLVAGRTGGTGGRRGGGTATPGSAPQQGAAQQGAASQQSAGRRTTGQQGAQPAAGPTRSGQPAPVAASATQGVTTTPDGATRARRGGGRRGGQAGTTPPQGN